MSENEERTSQRTLLVVILSKALMLLRPAGTIHSWEVRIAQSHHFVQKE